MDAASYNKQLTENITKTYKLAHNDTARDINTELKDIATKLKIGNRIETMAESQAFISLKDHKDDFEIHPKCRLINPAKSNLGKVSKAILDKINTEIRNKTQATQWRNSDDTISWFKSLNDKNKHRFMSFDVVDFYPSINEELLDQAIEWGKQFTSISDGDIKIIKHARKSLLFNNGRAWTKRCSNNTFDVTMGSFDGAEICELVGLYILQSLEEKFGKQIGLYRDDGLAIIKSTSGRVAEKAKQELIRIFDIFGLKITAQANLERINFLDITFDLTNGTYKPYRKPNDDPLYINRLSNHPPTIIRQLPTSINNRINKLSCDEETFNAAKPLYNNALKQSNFDSELTYEPATVSDNGNGNRNHSQRRTRQRNAIWYNPPYSINVKTNVGRKFLQLIDNHFPATNKLHQIFNRHTVRVSYGCMENMQTTIRKHNNAVLRKHANQQNATRNDANQQNPATNNDTPNTCNCRQTDLCPLNGNCLAKSVIYQAEITQEDNAQTKSYIGVTSGEFKTRHRNHTKSFRHQKYSQDTELSKYVWRLKENDKKYNIKWSIIKTIPAYKPGAKRCNLCLEEKLQVMKRRTKNMLNKRSELFSTCRHVTRHLISQCIIGVT